MPDPLVLEKEDVLGLINAELVNYEHANGFIKSPGRFQGEPTYSLYFHLLLMEGGPEYDDGDGDAYFEIKPAEREVFPTLPADQKYIYIQTSDDGFVGHGFSNSLPNPPDDEGGEL